MSSLEDLNKAKIQENEISIGLEKVEIVEENNKVILKAQNFEAATILHKFLLKENIIKCEKCNQQYDDNYNYQADSNLISVDYEKINGDILPLLTDGEKLFRQPDQPDLIKDIFSFVYEKKFKISNPRIELDSNQLKILKNKSNEFNDFYSKERQEKLQKTYQEYSERFFKYPTDNDWFFRGPTIENNTGFKVNIQIHEDDIDQAIKILIKEGLFYDELNWNNSTQKLPIQHSDRLSIILYENDNSLDQNRWKNRLSLIESKLFEAGIKTRALNLHSTSGSKINDKKIEGSIYCYYKKDSNDFDENHLNPNHNYSSDESGWAVDKGVVGSVKIESSSTLIEKKIKLIEKKISETQNSQDTERLEKLKEAYEFYKNITQLKHEDAQKIQHNKKESEQGQKGLKDKLKDANNIILQNHYLLNVTFLSEIATKEIKPSKSDFKTINIIDSDFRSDQSKHSPEKRKRLLKEFYQKKLNEALEENYKKIIIKNKSTDLLNLSEDAIAEVIVNILKVNSQRFEEIQFIDSQKIIDSQKNSKILEEKAQENLKQSKDTQENKFFYKIKNGFEKSMTPMRYRAILHIFNNNSLGNIDETLLNQIGQDKIFLEKSDEDENEKQFINFDTSEDENYPTEGKEELIEFNNQASSFFTKDDDAGWKKIADFISNEAKAKDILSIKNKFKLKESDAEYEKIKKIFEIFYDENSSDESLKESLAEYKKLIAKARLQNKTNPNNKEDVHKIVDEIYQNNTDSKITKDNEYIEKLNINKSEPEKIFNKFISIGEVYSTEKLRDIIVGKKYNMLQEIFSEKIIDIKKSINDELKTTKTFGYETFFRGIYLESKNETTLDEQEKKIDEIFSKGLIPQPKSMIKNERQGLGSFDILSKRMINPAGEGSKISYAVATSTSLKTAINYAISSSNKAGWIFEIKPQKDKICSLPRNDNNYYEVSFANVSSDEIYAAHYIELSYDDKENDDICFLLKKTKSIHNPHFRKQKEKMKEGEEDTNNNKSKSKYYSIETLFGDNKNIILNYYHGKKFNLYIREDEEDKKLSESPNSIELFNLLNRKSESESKNPQSHQSYKKILEDEEAKDKKNLAENKAQDEVFADINKTTDEENSSQQKNIKTTPSKSPKINHCGLIFYNQLGTNNSYRKKFDDTNEDEEKRLAGAYIRKDDNSKNDEDLIKDTFEKILSKICEKANEFKLSQNDLIKIFTISYKKGGFCTKISKEDQEKEGITINMKKFSQELQISCKEISILSAQDQETGFRTKRFGDIIGGEDKIKQVIENYLTLKDQKLELNLDEAKKNKLLENIQTRELAINNSHQLNQENQSTIQL